MKVKDEDILLRNNTGNKSKESLIEGYVIRLKEFENLFKNLKKSVLNNQRRRQFLVIGQRGSGKTTLLHRLNYAIEDDEQISATTIPVIFSEEQYHLTELTNLWESTAMFLEDNYSWPNLLSGIEKIIANNNDYETLVFEFLIDRLKQQKKSVVIIIENINTFLKKIDPSGRQRLKKILTEGNGIHLIG
jgi:Cdc6-like AAA superfamily ATPase